MPISYYSYILIISLLLFGNLLEAQQKTASQSLAIDFTAIQGLEGIPSQSLLKAFAASGTAVEERTTVDCLADFYLMEGCYFNIYLSPFSYTKDHIWILSKEPIAYEILSKQQLYELEYFRYLIGGWFLENRQYDGYIAFTDAKKTYGMSSLHHCLEMIPTNLKERKIDFLEKFFRFQYIFWGQGQKMSLLSKMQVDFYKKELAQRIVESKTIEYQKDNTQNTLPWTNHFCNIAALAQAAKEQLLASLQKQNAIFSASQIKEGHLKLSEDENLEVGGEFDLRSSTVHNCTFCCEQAIKSQLVYQTDRLLILYNYKPYNMDAHFLVLPKPGLHIENLQNASSDLAIEMMEFNQLIVQSIQQEKKNADVVTFIQNGPVAGMTVPHIHWHILLRPSNIHLAAQALMASVGVHTKGLTTEETAALREKYYHHISGFIQKKIHCERQ